MNKKIDTTKKFKKMGEDDSELVEMELDNFEMESSVVKSKTVKNLATKNVHINLF